MRSQSAAAPPVESSVARAATVRRSVTTPTQRSPSRQTEIIRSPSATVIRGCASDALGQLACDPVTGRGAASVHDTAPAVSSLEAEAVVELHPELDEIADSRRRLVGEHRHGARTTEATSGAKRVLGVK